MSTINIDISDLYRAKGRSGIQRVLRELVPRLIDEKRAAFEVRVMNFNAQEHYYEVFDNADVKRYLAEKADRLKVVATLRLDGFTASDTFFDIDSAWNIPLKRPDLYRRLKRKGVRIITLLHDVVPIKFPAYAHQNTLRNYALFVSAVYAYSDLVICNSRTTERDFLDYKQALKIPRHIPTVVSKLGSDFQPAAKATASEQVGLKEFIDQKFFLFVGTIEPRKRHDLALDAFETIIAAHPEVHLVLAGKQGWNVEAFMSRLTSHRLYGKNIHWVDTPSDPVLHQLYRECFGAVYLSNYEGFGLPVSEPLANSKLTITSRNSSLYEAGQDYADYVYFNTANEVVETVTSYLKDDTLYRQRSAWLADYRPYSWQTVYQTIFSVLDNTARVEKLLAKPRPKSLQCVFISNAPPKLKRTIPLIDKYMSFVDEYLIITPARHQAKVEAIPTKAKLTVISDEKLLGGRLPAFRAANHVLKNWMLRSSLATLPAVRDEFIMLDDDNQPLAPINIGYYINDDRTYNAYYFYDLPFWPHYNTDYDFGQQHMKKVLDEAGCELLIYSSHMPQVFNKAIFKEAVEKFDPVAQGGAVDEWSAYFNYAVSRYPTLFQKKLFETLNWPARPTDWQHQYEPPRFTFENYYDHLYADSQELFASLPEPPDTAAKLELKRQQMAPFHRSQRLYIDSQPYLSRYGLAHGLTKFSYANADIYLAGLPYLITTAENATLRLVVDFKLITSDELFVDEVTLCWRGHGCPEGQAVLRSLDDIRGGYLQGLLSLPIRSEDAGAHWLEFFIKVNGEPYENPNRSIRTKLLVCPTGASMPAVFKAL